MTYLSVGLDASVTTGPIEGSRKVYRKLAEVPVRGCHAGGWSCPMVNTSISTTRRGPIPTPTR